MEDLKNDIDPQNIPSDPVDELEMVIDESDPLLDQSEVSEQVQESLLDYRDVDQLDSEELDAALVDYSDDALTEDI